MTARTALIVLAKAPVAGLAKTRLIPALGPAGAAALAERLLNHAVGQGAAAGFGALELCGTPDVLHPAFLRLQAAYSLSLTLQGEGDLGARMHRALQSALLAWPQALLIGTDAPALDATRLRAAARALAAPTTDAVFVPAVDGGYALVGLKAAAASLFEGMTWSTPQVMQQTRERALAAGLRCTELSPVADIDEPADLHNLPAHWMEPSP